MDIQSEKSVALKNLKELLTDVQDRRCSADELTIHRMIQNIQGCPEESSFDDLGKKLVTTKGHIHTIEDGVGMVRRALGLERCGRCEKFCRRTCPVE